MDQHNQLSPKEAIAGGLLMAAIGFVVVLSVAGVLFPGARRAADAPSWVGICAGLVFVFSGFALIVGFAVAGGAAPDGNLPPGTPRWARLTQSLLGLGITNP